MGQMPQGFVADTPMPEGFVPDAAPAAPNAADILSGAVGRDTNLSDAPKAAPGTIAGRLFKTSPAQIDAALTHAAHPQTGVDMFALLSALPGSQEFGGELLSRGYQALKAAAADAGGMTGKLSIPFRAIGKFSDALPSNAARVVANFAQKGEPASQEAPQIMASEPDIWDTLLAERRTAAPVTAVPSGLSDVERAALAKQGYTPDVISRIEQSMGADAAPAVSHDAASASSDASPLRQPRIDVGAQRVAQQTGKTIQQVRQETGPVLGEQPGEASPILPQQALGKIVDAMRQLPPGAAREAYVARATSGKAQWQIENIRRTLEHLGLLVPISTIAPAVRQRVMEMMASHGQSDGA